MPIKNLSVLVQVALTLFAVPACWASTGAASDHINASKSPDARFVAAISSDVPPHLVLLRNYEATSEPVGNIVLNEPAEFGWERPVWTTTQSFFLSKKIGRNTWQFSFFEFDENRPQLRSVLKKGEGTACALLADSAKSIACISDAGVSIAGHVVLKNDPSQDVAVVEDIDTLPGVPSRSKNLSELYFVIESRAGHLWLRVLRPGGTFTESTFSKENKNAFEVDGRAYVATLKTDPSSINRYKLSIARSNFGTPMYQPVIAGDSGGRSVAVVQTLHKGYRLLLLQGSANKGWKPQRFHDFEIAGQLEGLNWGPDGIKITTSQEGVHVIPAEMRGFR